MAGNASDNKDKDGDKKEGGAPPPESGSKISNTEWGMVIGALGLIDIVQLVLTFVGIGLIANTFIDILVGMAWPTYLHLRGVNLKSAKMFGSILLTFIFETLPVLNALPLWFLDGIAVFSLVKAEKLISKATEVAVAAAAIAAAPETGGASLAAEGAIEGGLAAGEAGGAAAEGAAGAEEGGISDEATDAMGQESDAGGQESESDNPYGDESEEDKSERMAGEEGDGDHEISDEDAENENTKNESQSEGDKDDKNKDNDKKKKKPEEKQRNNLFGDSGRGGNSSPDSRNKNRYRSPEEKAEDEKLSFHSNLLDLSDPYAARKKKENEESSHSE